MHTLNENTVLKNGPYDVLAGKDTTEFLRDNLMLYDKKKGAFTTARLAERDYGSIQAANILGARGLGTVTSGASETPQQKILRETAPGATATPTASAPIVIGPTTQPTMGRSEPVPPNVHPRVLKARQERGEAAREQTEVLEEQRKRLGSTEKMDEVYRIAFYNYNRTVAKAPELQMPLEDLSVYQNLRRVNKLTHFQAVNTILQQRARQAP